MTLYNYFAVGNFLFALEQYYHVCIIAGIMEGIDEVELQMSTSDLVPECVGAAKLFAHLHTNGVLVSGIPAAATPLSDYDPMWLVHSHPSIFPHGTVPSQLIQKLVQTLSMPTSMLFVKSF